MRYLVLFLLAGIAMGQAIPFSFTLAGDVSHVQPGDCFKVSPTYTLEKIDCPAKAAFVPTGDLIAPKSEPACDPRTCGTRVGFFSGAEPISSEPREISATMKCSTKVEGWKVCPVYDTVCPSQGTWILESDTKGGNWCRKVK